jgi:signal transduction histidine kinase
MNDAKNINMNPDTLLTRIEHLENHRRFIHNALEMALSLGDFQENINKGYGPEHILQEAEKRINHLIGLNASVLYLVDQNQSDFRLSQCSAPKLKDYVENEVEHMIDQGYFAWAIREKRGVFISSRDHTRKFILHVVATYSRIRGMFVGLLPCENQKIPDTSLTLLSIILLNIANALESLEFYTLLRHQNTTLEKKVEERTEALARSERQLQQVLKIQAIGTLAGGIAHDFNNILFPIVGYTELTLDEVAADRGRPSGQRPGTADSDLQPPERTGTGAAESSIHYQRSPQAIARHHSKHHRDCSPPAGRVWCRTGRCHPNSSGHYESVHQCLSIHAGNRRQT